ncbi:MAG: cell wall hydrolase [Paracoccaceae bacterium]
MLIELCLSLAVYHEARGEPLEGQRAVAEVVMNRVGSPLFPNDVCAVIKDPYQFSFVSQNGWAGIPDDQDKWADAVIIAQRALDNFQSGFRTMNDENVLWYHRHDISLVWTKCLEQKAQIGNHVFFTTKQQSPQTSLRPKKRPKALEVKSS